jgi:hypothetical protein
MPVPLATRPVVPDKLAIRVDAPNGATSRWAEDELSALNVLSDIEFSDEIPGGYKELGGVLARNPRGSYQDLIPYGDLKVYTPGGEVVWQGSLDKGPGVSGDEFHITPAALGYQYILEDDQAASIGFIDCDMSKWTDGSTRRKIGNLNSSFAGRPYRYTQEVSTSSQDPTNGAGIFLVLSSVAAGTTPFGELVYFSEGPEIGEMRFDYRVMGGIGKDASMFDAAALGPDDTSTPDITPSFEQVQVLNTSLKAKGKNRQYAYVQGSYIAAIEGNFTNTRGFFNIRIIGTHGLPVRGTWPNIGFSAKQMFEYVIQNYASPLTVDSDFVDDDGFVIPQAWYPGVSLPEIVNDITKYGLYDWFVYTDKRIELRKPQTYNRFWRAPVAPSSLEQVGQDSQRLWRRIVVRFTDASGVTQYVGPPGWTTGITSSELEITDPEHPAVKANRTRRDVLDLQGVSTPATAITVGKRFLEEAALLDRSGSATLSGYVLDSYGVLRPVSQVKSGDWISFSDATDTGYRKIISKQYRHNDRSAEIDLDAPASGMDALLERFQASLIPGGLTSA